MTKGFAAAALLCCLATFHASAVQRFLVPIHLEDPVAGAFGSRWVSELAMLNTGSTEVWFENYAWWRACGRISAPCLFPLYPKVNTADGSFHVLLANPFIPAAILLLNDRFAGQVVFQARVRDTSRSADSWGVSIPVVPESHAVRGQLTLLDIPIHERYRQTLRVYSFDLAADRVVRIRIYGAPAVHPGDPDTYAQPNALLTEMTVPLRYAPSSPSTPLYAEIHNLASVPGVTGEFEKLWISVEPEGDFGVWGMVSVTNNATHEITMILPQLQRSSAAQSTQQ